MKAKILSFYTITNGSCVSSIPLSLARDILIEADAGADITFVRKMK